MAREELSLVKCTDRAGDNVDNLREEHTAWPLWGPAGEKIVGSMLVYRSDDLEQAKAGLDGEPCARYGIWGTIVWSREVLADRTLASSNLLVPLGVTPKLCRCPTKHLACKAAHGVDSVTMLVNALG